jgi:hypothetical protein
MSLPHLVESPTATTSNLGSLGKMSGEKIVSDWYLMNAESLDLLEMLP